LAALKTREKKALKVDLKACIKQIEYFHKHLRKAENISDH